MIPAQETRKVIVNFTDPNNVSGAPFKLDSLKFVLMTSSGHYFKTYEIAPSPVPAVGIKSEDYTITARDVIDLDASNSNFPSNSFASTYVWRIDNTNKSWAGD